MDRQTDRQRQIETDILRQRKRQTDRDRETDRQRQIETDRCLQAADRNRERRTRTEKDGLAWARRASVICCCEGAILRPVGPARETAVESFLTVSEGNVRHPACGSCRLGSARRATVIWRCEGGIFGATPVRNSESFHCCL